jgi:hypothetical protein
MSGLLLAASAYAQGSQEPGGAGPATGPAPEVSAPKKEQPPQRRRGYTIPGALAHPEQRVNSMHKQGGFSNAPMLDIRIGGEGISLPEPAPEPKN